MLRLTILHIGLDKTGSTAIQVACANNKQALLDESILYPETDLNHGQLGSCFYDDPTEYDRNKELGRTDPTTVAEDDQRYLQKLLDEIEQSHASTLILSAEAFGFMHEVPVRRLRDFLITISERVLVVLYCRPPISYAVSALSQRARTGRPLWSEPPLQEIRKICRAYEDAFGSENIELRKFSRECFPAGDVRLDFFSLCGLSTEHVRRSFRLATDPDNSSLSAEAMLFADALRRAHSDQTLTDFEFSSKYEPLLRSIPGAPIRLTPQQAAEVVSASREHVSYAADRYRLELADNPAKANAAFPSFSPEALEAIARSYRDLLDRAGRHTSAHPDISTEDIIVGQVELTEGSDVEYGQFIVFKIEFYVTRPLQNLELGIHIFDQAQRWAFGTNSRLLGKKFTDLPPGRHCVTHHVVANLPIGSYSAGFAFTERMSVGEKQLAWFDALCNFRVTREEDQLFAGYAYLPTEITLSSTPPAADRAIVHDASGRLETSERLSVLAPNQSLSVPLTIHNNGIQDWLGDFFRPISIAYRWLEPATGRVLIEGGRSALPQGRLAAGCLLQTSLNITTPNTPGAYTLLITLVQERVAWFDRLSSSFQPTRLDISIEATPTD